MLDIPYRRQQLTYSCFPACVRMVLRFYRDNIDEKTLYKNSLLPDHKGAWDAPLARFLMKKGYKCVTYWDGPLDGWGLSPITIRAYKEQLALSRKEGMLHKRGVTLDGIRRLIDKGVPVLAEVNADEFYGRTFGCTHMVLVVGYDRSLFFVHDPEKIIGRPARPISNKKFRRCWERLGKGAGRSLFVVFPKKTTKRIRKNKTLKRRK